jgi:hypothetical protein
VRALEVAPPEPAVDAASPEPVSWSDINPERPATTAPPLPPLPRLTLGMIPEDLTPEPPRPVAPPEPIELETTAAFMPPAPLAAPVFEAPAPPPPAPPAAAPPPPMLEITGLEEFAQFSAPIAPPPPARPSLPDIAAYAPAETDLPPLETKTGEFSASALARPSAPEIITHETQAPPAPVRAGAPEEEEPPLYTPPSNAPVMPEMPEEIPSLRDTLSFRTPHSMPAQPPVAPPVTPPPAPPEPVAADKRATVDNWGSVTDLSVVAAAQSQEEAYDPTVGRMLDLSVNSGNDIPAAFMTETMAELYLQQGYHDEALRIYRQLAQMRPEDPSLKERIARLEKGARSSVSVAASISEDVITAARDRASRPAQSIRSFFGGLAARKAPGATPPAAAPVVAAAAPVAAPPMAAPPVAAPPVFAQPVAPPPVESPPEPAAEVGTPESLSALFDDRSAAADDSAAAALAGAFNEEYATSITTPSSGQPSRAASQPLSLDDVFRGQKATVEQKRQGDNVSFDEFFSPRDSGNVPAIRNGGADRDGEQQGGRPQEADLALFHDWLDGLKK